MMLHGFSQTGACFDELAEAMAVRALAPDLPGHGPSPQGPVTLDSAVHQVAEVMKPLERPAPLLGYSQGGRIALQVALEHPELVRCLVLLSSSAGIEDEAERAARRATDEARAVAIERDGVSVFLDAWSAMALFSGLAQRDEAWRARDRARRMTHTASGLAAALRGLGVGQQPHLLGRMIELPMPALFMAGTRDPDYCERALQMAQAAPLGAPVFLPNAGHALVGEAPWEVARALRAWR